MVVEELHEKKEAVLLFASTSLLRHGIPEHLLISHQLVLDLLSFLENLLDVHLFLV